LKRHAWAIALDPRAGALAGIFYFTGSDPMPYHDGMRIALFRTRQQARDAFAERSIKTSWPKARVVGVSITFEVTR
jgi:hypothetical protein